MPFIESTYKGLPYLNRHLETIIPALFRKINVDYSRERLLLADGDFIDLDWINNKSRNLLLLFHGLEGSSQSQYIKGFAKFFSDKTWDVCAMNYRTCSGEMNKLLRSYHSGSTEDVNAVVQHIDHTRSYDSIAVVGFSLGGNLLLKYLGESKERVHPAIKVACTFSVPIDLAASSVEMSKPHNWVYLKLFLRTLSEKVGQKAKLFPGTLDPEKIQHIKSFHEFDDIYTAPVHGFKDADDYYERCSAINYIKDIKVPTLLVNAQNDPFLSAPSFPKKLAEEQPNFYFEMPEKGGHVGFSLNFTNTLFWSEMRAWTFVEQVLFK